MRNEARLMSAILTRGLAAAVLATLPAQYGLEYADLFVNIAVVVIVTTAIIATLGVFLITSGKSPVDKIKLYRQKEKYE
jgi:NhaP-type Na+/H+ or K+/H+ antiporter